MNTPACLALLVATMTTFTTLHAGDAPPATRPAVTQPEASQPAASQPAASQPAASQPAASQPAASQPAATQPAASQPATRPAGRPVAITFSGGHDTDRRDGGRPVVLIAAALGVSDDVFRDAFNHVRPSRNGPPSGDEARKNKDALLSRLARHGVTNDRLDEVSNYYRYRPQASELWKHRAATAVAYVDAGKITGLEITDAGAGYSSAPAVSIADLPDVKLIVTLRYGKDLATNGSVATLAVVKEAPQSAP